MVAGWPVQTSSQLDMVLLVDQFRPAPNSTWFSCLTSSDQLPAPHGLAGSSVQTSSQLDMVWPAQTSYHKLPALATVPDKSLVAWVQIDLKCPSIIFLINIFLQEMAHFNPNSFWINVLVQNETVEKYSNVHSLVKPIESIFAKIKVLSPCHMMHPILD